MKTKPYISKAIRKYRRNRKIGYAALIISILLLGYLCLSVYQKVRYDADGYNCKGMSRDCEAFFETIGIRTQKITGIRYDDNGELSAHCWLLLDLPILGKLEFESTTLMFGKTSAYYCIYSIDEGWI